MCFQTTKSARAKIAKTDIECWKIITRSGHNSFSICFGKKIKYVVGILQPTVNILKKCIFERYEIYKGYHSYKSLKIAKEDLVGCKGDYDRYKKFIIPAGTRYFENKTQYVSETIILIDAPGLKNRKI